MRALFSRPLLMLSTSNWMLWTSYGHWQTMNNTVVFDVPSRWIKLWNFTQILEFFTVQSLRVINRHIIGESAVAGEIQGSQDWCRLLTKDDDNTKANVTSSSGLLLLRTPMSPSVNSSVCLLLLIWCDIKPRKDIQHVKVSSYSSANNARSYQPIATKSILSVGRLLSHFHVVNTIRYTIHTCQYTTLVFDIPNRWIKIGYVINVKSCKSCCSWKTCQSCSCQSVRWFLKVNTSRYWFAFSGQYLWVMSAWWPLGEGSDKNSPFSGPRPLGGVNGLL